MHFHYNIYSIPPLSQFSFKDKFLPDTTFNTHIIYRSIKKIKDETFFNILWTFIENMVGTLKYQCGFFSMISKIIAVLLGTFILNKNHLTLHHTQYVHMYTAKKTDCIKQLFYSMSYLIHLIFNARFWFYIQQKILNTTLICT